MLVRMFQMRQGMGTITTNVIPGFQSESSGKAPVWGQWSILSWFEVHNCDVTVQKLECYSIWIFNGNVSLDINLNVNSFKWDTQRLLPQTSLLFFVFKKDVVQSLLYIFAMTFSSKGHLPLSCMYPCLRQDRKSMLPLYQFSASNHHSNQSQL